MSINCNELQNSPKEEEGKIIKLENPYPNHEIQSESHQSLGDTDRGEEEDDTKINDEEESFEAKIASKESEKSVPEEEEDGFKTPTSIDHKIPAITQCPPPPSKTRPQFSTLKRRAYSEARRRLWFVTAAEAETVFSTVSGLNVEEKRTKKARTGDDEI